MSRINTKYKRNARREQKREITINAEAELLSRDQEGGKKEKKWKEPNSAEQKRERNRRERGKKQGVAAKATLDLREQYERRFNAYHHSGKTWSSNGTTMGGIQSRRCPSGCPPGMERRGKDSKIKCISVT